MTTNTMVAIQTQVLGSNQSSVTFSSIPTTYTDLVLVCNHGNTSAGTVLYLQVGNGSVDTGSNYSNTNLYGNGSSAYSNRQAENWIRLNSGDGNDSINSGNISVINLMNYANTNTYKTFLFRDSAAGSGRGVSAEVGLWRSTAAINTLTLTSYSGGSILAGSTFTLYGIANADIGAYATGGIITQDSTYYYHAFGSSGTFTPSRALTADILVVAGGGGAGGSDGGGGGAGGLLAFSSQSLASGTGYTCTVGGPGAAGTASSPGFGTNGGQGGNSQFGALTAAVGGGYGGGSNLGGGNGGSGGGGSGGNGGSPTSGQGYAGGTATASPYTISGGGGAGQAGGNATASQSGYGGNGVSTYSSWLTPGGYGVLNSSDGLRYIAGGGGGGGYTGTTAAGAAGLGGGGKGGVTTDFTSGVPNTGGGGGGIGSNTTGTSGTGGSGIIIVRYAK